MSLPIPEKEFTKFLIKAKKNTYASTDPSQRVQPTFSGSTQFEYRQGALLYRDIYFGAQYFVGLETVYHAELAVWGMSYAGGINSEISEEIKETVYQFLAQALRAVTQELPFRGPKSFENGIWQYSNHVLGDFQRFSGTETIQDDNYVVYKLHYSGGLLR
jgi:hypothetical protein